MRTFEEVERSVLEILDGYFGGDESGVVAEVLFMLEAGILAEAYGWPPVIRYEREFNVPAGRIDVMLFHNDGSGTVIECKVTNEPRLLLPAIGQLMSYGVKVGYSRVLTKTRLALASRASAAELGPIKDVMRAARIEPIFTGQHKHWARDFASDAWCV